MMPDPESRAWTLSWYLAGHRVLTFRPDPRGIHVQVRLPERMVPSLVEDHQVDEEFRESILRAKPLRGFRSIRVLLDSAPRANTLGRVLEGIAHRAEGL